MAGAEGAKRQPGRGKPARQPGAIDADNVDALFAMDHLPIYPQHYRKASGLAVDAKLDEKRSDKAIDDVESRAKPIAAASAAPRASKDEATAAGPKREIRELRLGRVTRKHVRETPPSVGGPSAAVPALTTVPVSTTRRSMQSGILTSVQRRSIPSRRSNAGSASRPGRKWRLKATAIVVLALAAILWPTNEPVEQFGVGQGGPVILPEQEVAAVATTSPDEASIDAALDRAGVSPIIDMQAAEPSAPPPSIETVGTPILPEADGRGAASSSPVSTATTDAGTVTETALAAILTAIKRQETRAEAVALSQDRSSASVIPTEENASAPPSPSSVDAERQPADDAEIGAPVEGNGPTDIVDVARRGSEVAFDSRIVVHMSARDPPDAVMRALVDAGYRQPEFRRVDFAVSAANVRYFFADDRSDAELIDRIVAEALGRGPATGPRDFTHYRPLPIQDTVEVWVAD